MEMNLKEKFEVLWERFFPKADLPIVFYYSNDEERAEMVPPPETHRCLICDLGNVRRGKSLAFNINALGCGGGKRYLGFTNELMPDFEYFLSYGVKGKLEGERYKKSPALVKEQMKHQTTFKAPASLIIFKRWDRLEKDDDSQVVIFFAPPDILSGLFTLANYDEAEPNGVIAPFCAGCASIVDFPFKELRSDRPRAVLGMFDVSARPCAPFDSLSFAVPWSKFVRMVGNMEESFLVTGSWDKVRKRIKKVS